MHEGKWTVQFDDNDNWDLDEIFNTKEEAIKWGKQQIIKDSKEKIEDQEYEHHDYFRVGLYCRYEYNFDSYWLKEHLMDNAYEECLDFADTYNLEHIDVLVKRLNLVLRDWEKEFNCAPNFGVIEKEEDILIKEVKR